MDNIIGPLPEHADSNTPRIGQAVTYRGMDAVIVEHVTLSVVWIEYATGNRARVHTSTLEWESQPAAREKKTCRECPCCALEFTGEDYIEEWFAHIRNGEHEAMRRTPEGRARTAAFWTEKDRIDAGRLF